jgi:hypothetical protein
MFTEIYQVNSVTIQAPKSALKNSWPTEKLHDLGDDRLKIFEITKLFLNWMPQSFRLIDCRSEITAWDWSYIFNIRKFFINKVLWVKDW